MLFDTVIYHDVLNFRDGCGFDVWVREQRQLWSPQIAHATSGWLSFSSTSSSRWSEGLYMKRMIVTFTIISESDWSANGISIITICSESKQKLKCNVIFFYITLLCLFIKYMLNQNICDKCWLLWLQILLVEGSGTGDSWSVMNLFGWSEGGNSSRETPSPNQPHFGPKTIFTLNFQFSHKRGKFKITSAPVKEQVGHLSQVNWITFFPSL